MQSSRRPMFRIWTSRICSSSIAPQCSAGSITGARSRLSSALAMGRSSSSTEHTLARREIFNLRYQIQARPFFPLSSSNLRDGHGDLLYRKRRAKKFGKGKKGIYMKQKKVAPTYPKTWIGGNGAIYSKIPKWPLAAKQPQLIKKSFELLNLSKLRYYIEQGRLDTSCPITQRHLYVSGCVSKVRNGVKIFNVNDYPFPYKVDIEVASADQSSINNIKRVGGSVTIVYRDRVSLKAHIKPYKFELLPKSLFPSVPVIHALEKLRARGAIVKYPKPTWLLDEEKRLAAVISEERAIDDLVSEKENTERKRA